MKPFTKNKWIILVLVIAIMITGFVLLRPKYLSPKETVDQYFTHWDNKNIEGMRSMMLDPDELTEPDPTQYLEYVHLKHCFEEKDNEKNNIEFIQENWYPDAQYAQRVHVLYDIQFDDEAPRKRGYNSGVTGATYYLAKKTEKNPWMIVACDNSSSR